MPDARITIEGGVPWDPRYNATQNGTPVGTLTVLAGRSRRLDNGEWEDVTKTQYSCTFWREHHDLLAALHPEKGSQVVVDGTVEGIDKFTAQNGTEYLSVKVNASGLKVKPRRDQRPAPQRDDTGWTDQQGGFPDDPPW